MELNSIKPAEGSKKARRRVGRGIGSGLGKTAGRGHKGQKSRAGGYHKVGFEGGQMPLHMRLPKRGFKKPNRLAFNEVNLGRIQEAIDAGKLDAGATVTAEALVSAGVLRRAKDGVRLLVYAGDADMACNYVGNERWVEELETKFQPEFKKNAKQPWVTLDKGELSLTTDNEVVLILTESNGGTRISSTRYVHYGKITASRALLQTLSCGFLADSAV